MYRQILSWVLLLAPGLVSGQSIQNVVVDVDRMRTQILVSYDLVASQSPLERYKIRLFYSQDGGDTFSDTLRFVTGDVGDAIAPGIAKTIYWNYFVENADFDGKRVLFKIEAERDWQFERLRLAALGGPESAFYSLLLPGWGQQKVKGKGKFWWFTASTYGLLGSGLILSLNSDRNYDKYQDSENPEQAADRLQKARKQGRLGGGLLIAGGLVWLADIAWVLIRGKRNRGARQKVNEKLQDRVRLSFASQPGLHRQSIGLSFRF